MNAIELLEKAWLQGKLPIIYGIVINNGLYYKVEYSKNQIKVAPSIPFSYDFSGDWYSKINILYEITIGKYTLYCGEGSWGGDGFIYIENTITKKLLWCIFDDINPIIKCMLSDNRLIAENNNGNQYIFEFDNPQKVTLLEIGGI